MPLIKDRGRNYLTKDANNDEFHQNYTRRLDELTKQKQETEMKIEDLELDAKRLDGEEQIANLMQADKSKLKKLIPIYREKRAIKENLKSLKVKLIDLNAKIEKVELMDKNLAMKENIFTAININLDKVRHRKTSNARINRYHDKQIDMKKLKHVKRGMYLDILENANFNKLSFKKNERKYDLQHIIEKERQYKQEVDVKQETAALRHRARIDKLERRFLDMKDMRNSGDYKPVRSSLYPEELLDVEYSDYMQHRGMSASSVNNRQPGSSL